MKGSKVTNFETVLPPVSDPVISGVVTGPPLIKNTSATMAAGSLATPTNYVLTSLRSAAAIS